MMAFDWHAPIISYHINTLFFNSPRGKIPAAWKADIRFFYLLSVHIKSAGTKLNLLALSSDDAFEKHDLASCKTHCHHIMPFRF
jgi:hypothetical protein